MIEVNGLTIEATPMQVLRDLKNELESQGVYRFSKIRSSVNNIQFTCPFHANGQESKPSCGMSTVASIRGSRVTPAGAVHCFTCGYSSKLDSFISNCFGMMDGGIFGNRWLRKRYTTSVIVIRDKIQLDMSRGSVKQQNFVKPVNESELRSYRRYHPYMGKRGLTREIIRQFDIGYDKDRDCLTFPVKSINGEVMFVPTRSVRNKFFAYPEGFTKTDYLYGDYEVRNCEQEIVDVAITESVFNCLTMWKLGMPAISLMGLGGGRQFDLLKKLPGRGVIIALDPDEAGDKAALKIREELSDFKIIKSLQYSTECYTNKWDINDLDERVLDFPVVLF